MRVKHREYESLSRWVRGKSIHDEEFGGIFRAGV